MPATMTAAAAKTRLPAQTFFIVHPPLFLTAPFCQQGTVENKCFLLNKTREDKFG
jgi:hypothetical protein